MPFIESLTLNLIDNQLHYSNGNKATVELPITVKISTGDATLYSCNDEHFIDYSPQTLGYYWIRKNTCLRTSKGLIFKTVTDKRKAVQTVLREDNKVVYQQIDWDRSIRPTGEKEYLIEKAMFLIATLNRAPDATWLNFNDWYLEIGTKKVKIIMDELEFR